MTLIFDAHYGRPHHSTAPTSPSDAAASRVLCVDVSSNSLIIDGSRYNTCQPPASKVDAAQQSKIPRHAARCNDDTDGDTVLELRASRLQRASAPFCSGARQMMISRLTPFQADTAAMPRRDADGEREPPCQQKYFSADGAAHSESEDAARRHASLLPPSFRPCVWLLMRALGRATMMPAAGASCGTRRHGLRRTFRCGACDKFSRF